MKSINFTVEEIIPFLIDGRKDQTIRMLFIPDYITGDKVKIVWRKKIDKNTNRDKILFIASITDIFPIQMKDITIEIAKRDGFKSIDDCKQKLADLNSKDSKKIDQMWGFVIRFKKTNETIDQEIKSRRALNYIPLL
jgi:hypothetical protein